METRISTIKVTQEEPNAVFATRSFGMVFIATNSYQKGGSLAVELMDKNNEPIAMLSVNIPESSHLLNQNEFFAKTWSENAELARDALDSGLFEETGRSSGDKLNAKIWAFR